MGKLVSAIGLVLCLFLVALVAACGGGMTTTTVTLPETVSSTIASVNTTTTEATYSAAVLLAGSWSEVRVVGDRPEPRDGCCLVYEPEGRRLLLFGGWGEDVDFNDLWTFDLASLSWTELRPHGKTPSGRGEAAMAYDPLGKQVYLFGGWNDEDEMDLGDTWVYDPAVNAWTELDPAGETPTGRNAHSLIYDPHGERLILFGGSDQEGLEYSDVWAYDPDANAWTELDPAGATPPGRGWHGAAYDSSNGCMIIFGGGASEEPEGELECLNDTWAYDLESDAWTELRPAGDLPGEILDVAMAYDPVNRMVVFHGGGTGYGFLLETWVLDTDSGEWARVALSGRLPSSVAGHTSVYDPVNETVLLFGGRRLDGGYRLNELWAYEPSDLAEDQMGHLQLAPSPRAGQAAVYDPVGQQTIIFGGESGSFDWGDGVYYQDTWAYDGSANQWMDLKPSGDLPAGRSDHAMVYDPVGKRVILFGGWSEAAFFNDTWSYDPALDRWARLHPSGEIPSARTGHKLVYDTGSDTIIMFGGDDGYDDLDETWSYDPRADEWTEIQIRGDRPEARSYPVMFYDPVQERVVLMGGSVWTDEDESVAVALDSPWAYDAETQVWVELDKTGRSPSLRHTDGAEYDRVAERLVLFGGMSLSSGFSGAEALDDTWSYDPVVNDWSRSQPEGKLPPARSAHTMVYDVEQGRMVLFGGFSLGPEYFDALFLNDTWTYDLSTDTWTEVLPGATDLRQTSLPVNVKS